MSGFVLVSLCYVLRWLLQLVTLRVRSHEWKELEIVVLRHELAILRRQTRRPPIAARVEVLIIPRGRDRPLSSLLGRCFHESREQPVHQGANPLCVCYRPVGET